MKAIFNLAVGITMAFLCSFAHGQDKPNILIIWGDDVGMWNISAYHRGMMGGSTPNIDRIAKDGMIFMDHYAKASCTAGRRPSSWANIRFAPDWQRSGFPVQKRASRPVIRRLPRCSKRKATRPDNSARITWAIATSICRRCMGSTNSTASSTTSMRASTAEQHDYSKNAAVQESSESNSVASSTPCHCRCLYGGRRIRHWCREKQKTLDEEVLAESKRFMKDAVEADIPFFVWHNTTRMHYRTNLNEEYDGKSGYDLYANGMMEMDDDVGELLDTIEELGVADNTIVMFSTDNGAASNSWPDGGNQPFHGEKGAGGWEGGFRVPMLVKWKDKIPAGTHTGEFMTMEDWIPTLMSWVGQKNIKQELLTGKEIGGKNYRVHLDGYDQSDLLLNQGKSKRKDFYYFTETTFHGLRHGDWKLLFIDQDRWFRSHQTPLTSPFIINLKQDPFERFTEARGYDEWAENRSWIFGPAGKQIAEFVASFQEFPPSQKSMSLEVSNISDAINAQVPSR